MGNTQAKMRSNLEIENRCVKTCTVEKAAIFECLGTTLSEKTETEDDIKERLSRARKVTDVFRKAKKVIYQIIIKPTAIYACEKWVINKKKLRGNRNFWQKSTEKQSQGYKEPMDGTSQKKGCEKRSWMR